MLTVMRLFLLNKLTALMLTRYDLKTSIKSDAKIGKEIIIITIEYQNNNNYKRSAYIFNVYYYIWKLLTARGPTHIYIIFRTFRFSKRQK